MFELKPMSPENVEGALLKAERYRLLNEAWEADSICRDILAVDPGNVQAARLLLLATTDRFGSDDDNDVEEARSYHDIASTNHRYTAGPASMGARPNNFLPLRSQMTPE